MEEKGLLYLLEKRGFIHLNQELGGNPGWYNYKWTLTLKAKNLIKSKKEIMELWNNGNIKEFYLAIKEIS